MISAQILYESKTKWRVAPKRKTGAAAKQTADCTALQSQMTIEPSNQKSQMDQEYDLLPADARQQKWDLIHWDWDFCAGNGTQNIKWEWEFCLNPLSKKYFFRIKLKQKSNNSVMEFYPIKK